MEAYAYVGTGWFESGILANRIEQAMVGFEHISQDGDLAVDDLVLNRVP